MNVKGMRQGIVRTVTACLLGHRLQGMTIISLLLPRKLKRHRYKLL